ncbi:MAG: hypothetical protein PUK14_02765, partial [Clostridiales bacterium]|nr:hypothetical protein [Clostridiales bacterium]MDY6116382.1 hypothetical protein [Anaerovoracaceae bacterium]
LFELLKKTISKMPNGWGETVQVNLTNGWTAPCDGLLTFEAQGVGDLAYVSNGKNRRYIAVYAFAGGFGTSSNIARKGETYKISHKGANITEIYTYFTPFSYRGGYLPRLMKRLQSLFLKGVTA